jgi:hypothetical protein
VSLDNLDSNDLRFTWDKLATFCTEFWLIFICFLELREQSNFGNTVRDERALPLSFVSLENFEFKASCLLGSQLSIATARSFRLSRYVIPSFKMHCIRVFQLSHSILQASQTSPSNRCCCQISNIKKPQKLLKIHQTFQLFQHSVTLRKNSLASSKNLVWIWFRTTVPYLKFKLYIYAKLAFFFNSKQTY